MKIISTHWFTFSLGTIGIVVTENSVGERKARIASVQGTDETMDEKYVAENGAKIPFSDLKDILKELVGGNHEPA